MSDQKEKNIWVRIWGNPWWGWCVITAFISVISFFQINSYWADKHNFNGIFGWLGIGILFGVLAVFFLIKAKATSTGRGG